MENAENGILGTSMERRSFLKASAAAVVAGSALQAPGALTQAFAAEGQTESAGSNEVVTPGTCRGGCGHGCQMNVHVRNGKIVKTSRRAYTTPDLTRICNKGLTHALRVYAEDRLKYPMKRAGERGSGQWEQISWDEAVTLITDKWKEVAEKYGPEANAFFKSGGNISPDGHHAVRLCSAMGATFIDNAQDRVFYTAMPSIFGTAKGAGGCGRADHYKSKNIVLWGINYAEAYSQCFHYILRAKEEHGAKLIVIDTTYNTTSAKADFFVPIHSGTDGALALAMANVLVSEGLADEEFLSKFTVAPLLVKDADGQYLRLSDLGKTQAGSEQDKPVVRGSDGTVGLPEDVANPVLNGSFDIEGHAVTTAYDLLLERVTEWTPERASELCDVPVETIIGLAHTVADGPTSINMGLSLDHITNGFGTYCSITAMAMIAGQYGKRGTGGMGIWRGGVAMGWMPYGLAEPPGAPKHRTFSASAFIDRYESGKYGDEDLNIKTLYVWNHNLFGIDVGLPKWKKFLDDVELFVAVDVVATSTTAYADIVLPACHFFECESASGDDTPYVLYSAKAADPLYESKSDFDIAKLFFERMGLQEFDFETRDDLFNAVFDNPVAKSIGLTWDRVKKEEAVLTFEPDDRVFGEEGVFNTPTGRIQFYREKIPVDGGDFGQTIDFWKERLPYWDPPVEASRDNPLFEKYPLVYTSERSKFKVHTQYTRVPWLLEFEDEPYVAMNPADCADRGIADNDYVRAFNDRGEFTCRVRYNDGIRPGMVVIEHGWDQDQFVDGYYQDPIESHVTPVVANSYYNDVLVQVEKATI